jgi:hypothetical protein
MTLVGVWFWEPMSPSDWGLMAGLCVTGALGHWLLIRAYDVAEASAVQPFAFLQLLWVAISASRSSARRSSKRRHRRGHRGLRGLFTLWRERVRSKG